jgi:hypothetical protein
MGNREQGTGNREQGTGNREQGTGNREQGTGNREQGTATNIISILIIFPITNYQSSVRERKNRLKD